MHETTEEVHFHWIDYAVLGLSLALTVGIGVFFYFYDRRRHKESDANEYNMGGRDMNPVTTGMSIMASFINATFLIGAPAEVHYYGAIFALSFVSILPAPIIAAVTFIPIYRKAQITSCYEYLERRFHSVTARVAGSLTFSLSMILFLAVVLYAPALAFSQVTGLNIHIIQVVSGVICTLYVCLGGLKAVVWTDAIQLALMLSGSAVISAIGTIHMGGGAEVYRIVSEDNRLNFGTWSFDLRTRHTVWNTVFMGTAGLVAAFGSNQMVVQRYMAVSSRAKSNLSAWVAVVTYFLMLVSVTISGLVMHAYFRSCDPYVVPGHRRVDSPDQIFPLFLMEFFGKYPGLPGLYTSAVFAAALSSVSSILNSLSTLVSEDFVKPLYTRFAHKPLSSVHEIRLLKVLTVIFGAMSVGLSYVAPYMGDVLLEIPVTILATVQSPLSGMFLLAIFCPYANATGSLIGLLVSLVFAFWWTVGSIIHHSTYPILQPIGINCSADGQLPSFLIPGGVNMSLLEAANFTDGLPFDVPRAPQLPQLPSFSEDPLQYFYDMSYTYYSTGNMVVSFVVGLLASLVVRCMSKSIPPVDSALVYDFGSRGCCCCPPHIQNCVRCGVQHNKQDGEGKSQHKEYTNDAYGEEHMQ